MLFFTGCLVTPGILNNYSKLIHKTITTTGGGGGGGLMQIYFNLIYFTPKRTTVDSPSRTPSISNFSLSRTSFYLEQFSRSLSVNSNLILSIYLELVPCEFKIESPLYNTVRVTMETFQFKRIVTK